MARLSRWQDLRLLYGDTRSMCSPAFSPRRQRRFKSGGHTSSGGPVAGGAGNGHISVTSVLETDELLVNVAVVVVVGYTQVDDGGDIFENVAK